MLTNEVRPKRLSEMAGQKQVVQLAKAILKNPEGTPSTLIFAGSYGSGKTTLSRIIARTLNNDFTSDLDTVPWYSEFDATLLSGVDQIRDLVDSFNYSRTTGWNIIVFDECHILSQTAQSALLKTVEEAPPRTKFVFATTHPQKLLPTIVSRSLYFNFQPLSDKDLGDHLIKIASQQNITLSDSNLRIILDKAQGHPRNAIMYLEALNMLQDEFPEVYQSPRSLIEEFFRFKNPTQVIESLQQFPLSEQVVHFKNFLRDTASLQVSSPDSEFGSPKYLPIIKLCLSDWVVQSFENEELFHTALLVIHQLVSKQSKPKQQVKTGSGR